MKYYVNGSAFISGDGSEKFPFKTIQEAANVAEAGDEVVVFPGIYRESVNPIHPGTQNQRITYTSAEPLAAVITGAEEIKSWEPYQENVWLCRIPNGIFGNYNPYTTFVEGDWFFASFIAHTGEIYLNNKSLYEVSALSQVLSPIKSAASWDPDFSIYTWYTEQDEEKNETVLYANFHGLNPNQETVEINVRRTLFYPEKEGIGYITLSGFQITKAATQWAPPTAYQEGMVGPHWSKGWIIQDCDISHSKCSGISLGKYRQPENDNKWLKWKFKDGTQTERDCICQAQRDGWSKATIGSHIIRRCNIHDCGQTGIVGHLGGVFSLIEDNHIHHINNKQNLAGAEIGGIKMHAAIDVIYRRNHIHHCTRGLWLDWQAQGTRVTQNFFHHNCLPAADDGIEPDMPGLGEDIFIEVSHGPTLIDNNILLSDRSAKLATQGVAFVHNLIGGSFTAVGIGTDNGAKTLSSPRYTPYHVPHGTEIAGFMTFLHGDMRFYNNIFVQQPVRPCMQKISDFMQGEGKSEWDDGNIHVGTFPYDNGYQLFAEWSKEFDGYCGLGSEPSDRYYMHLPVWSEGNIYFNGATPWKKEKNYFVDSTHIVTLSAEEKDGAWALHTNLYDVLPDFTIGTISTETLGMAFEPEQRFENPDGSPILFNTDYLGNHRAVHPCAGPFENGKAHFSALHC